MQRTQLDAAEKMKQSRENERQATTRCALIEQQLHQTQQELQQISSSRTSI